MPLHPKSVTPDGAASPLWRKEFPPDVDDEAARSRRGFLGGITAASGAMVCGQMALKHIAPTEVQRSYPADHPSVSLGIKLHDVEIGEAVLFHFPDEKSPCLFVKLGDDEFVAYAQKCTHLACPVIPKPDASKLHCPCHHGSFDIRSGRPLAGPPRRALARIRIETCDDGTLIATGFLT